mgnify:CR=1 FL=1
MVQVSTRPNVCWILAAQFQPHAGERPRRRALDGADEAHGVLLRFLADLFHEGRPGLLGGQPTHAFEGGDLVGPGGVQLGTLGVQLLLADEQLAIALLEHVGALIELLVALEEATFVRANFRR